MTEAEFLLDLRTKVFDMGDPVEIAHKENVREMKVRIVEMDQKGLAKSNAWYPYQVLNTGKVAGPQVYEADVLEEDPETGEPVDPPVVIHAAGDPKLDENGDQIVLSPLEAELAFAEREITLPVDKGLVGATYLQGLVEAGSISNFDLIRSVPDRNFIEFMAAVPTTAGKEKWVKRKASFNPDLSVEDVEIEE